MQLLDKILVATDFSPAADAAVRTAAFVAGRFRSEVFLLHVIPGTADFCPDERGVIDRKVTGRLSDLARELREYGVEKIETIVDNGVVFDQIDRRARQLEVNAILIGGGSTDDSGQFYLGNTAARLRRRSTAPVWIVRPDAAAQISRILCPTDFSAASARALRNAIHLARGFDAELTVLTVSELLASDYEDLLGPDAAADQTPPTPIVRFDKFLEGFDFHGVQWTKVVRRGKPYREILKLVAEFQADLLVMGSVGRTGLSRMLIGGVARRVAQQMPCSIITVRSEDPIRLHVEHEVPEMDPEFCATKSPDDVCLRYEHGHELLEQGFAEEALEHFRECVAKYILCSRAWQSLAIAHERLGHMDEARECEKRAEAALTFSRNKEVEDDIRAHHLLYRPMFGVK